MYVLKASFSSIPDQGIEVAEFGCGTGVLILELAGRYPNSRFHGSDISPHGLAIAREKLAESGLSNVTLSLADLHSLPGDMLSLPSFSLIIMMMMKLYIAHFSDVQ